MPLRFEAGLADVGMIMRAIAYAPALRQRLRDSATPARLTQRLHIYGVRLDIWCLLESDPICFCRRTRPASDAKA